MREVLPAHLPLLHCVLTQVTSSCQASDGSPLLQVLPKSQLPLLMSIMMVTQAFLSAPAGMAAKKSMGGRNRVILLGYAAMIGADLAFAFFTSPLGAGLGGQQLARTLQWCCRVVNVSLTADCPCSRTPQSAACARTAVSCPPAILLPCQHLQRPGAETTSQSGCLPAGMYFGAGLVGMHMALTHGVTLAMVASYIPTTEVPGIGKVPGTCWSFTDFVFGERCLLCALQTQSMPARACALCRPYCCCSPWESPEEARCRHHSGVQQQRGGAAVRHLYGPERRQHRLLPGRHCGHPAVRPGPDPLHQVWRSWQRRAHHCRQQGEEVAGRRPPFFQQAAPALLS